MEQIWKFQLEPKDVTVLNVPLNSKILTVQIQRGVPCVWILVNPSMVNKERFIQIFGTGQDIGYQDNKEYIGTYQEAGGALVWHLFEIL